jgi:hypothetical protein
MEEVLTPRSAINRVRSRRKKKIRKLGSEVNDLKSCKSR